MDRLRLESQRHPAAPLAVVAPPVAAARRAAIGGLLRHLAHGERVAERIARGQARLAQDARAARFFASQARQEAAHARVFDTAAVWLRVPAGAVPANSYDRYERRVQTALDRGDFVEAVIATQVVLEALGEALLARLDAGLARHGAGLHALRRRILAQEAAHHAFGRAQVGAWLDDGALSPADLARHLHDYGAEASALVRAAEPVLDHFALSPADIVRDVATRLAA